MPLPLQLGWKPSRLTKEHRNDICTSEGESCVEHKDYRTGGRAKMWSKRAEDETEPSLAVVNVKRSSGGFHSLYGTSELLSLDTLESGPENSSTGCFFLKERYSRRSEENGKQIKSCPFFSKRTFIEIIFKKD